MNLHLMLPKDDVPVVGVIEDFIEDVGCCCCGEAQRLTFPVAAPKTGDLA